VRIFIEVIMVCFLIILVTRFRRSALMSLDRRPNATVRNHDNLVQREQGTLMF
jgi:hypothetical protein